MQQMVAIFGRHSKYFFSGLNWEQFGMINIPRDPYMQSVLLYTLLLCRISGATFHCVIKEWKNSQQSHAMSQQKRIVDQNHGVPLVSSRVNCIKLLFIEMNRLRFYSVTGGLLMTEIKQFDPTAIC